MDTRNNAPARQRSRRPLSPLAKCEKVQYNEHRVIALLQKCSYFKAHQLVQSNSDAFQTGQIR